MTIQIGAIPPAPAPLSVAAAAAPKIPSTSDYAAPGALEPDFAVLFGVGDHAGPVLQGRCLAGFDDECAACAQLVTPRLAWLLSAGVDVLGDTWKMHDGDDAEWWLNDELPPVAIRYAERTPGWLGQFLGAVRDIGLTLEAGRVPRPNSTAEEMALHLVIAKARTYLEMAVDSYAAGDIEYLNRTLLELPRHAPASDDNTADLDWALDERLDELTELLFEDHDVLMLFDARLDGIEDDGDLATRMNLVNLRPSEWFTPFREVAADTPAAGS